MIQGGDLNAIQGRREQGAEEVEEHKTMELGLTLFGPTSCVSVSDDAVAVTSLISPFFIFIASSLLPLSHFFVCSPRPSFFSSVIPLQQ